MALKVEFWEVIGDMYVVWLISHNWLYLVKCLLFVEGFTVAEQFLFTISSNYAVVNLQPDVFYIEWLAHAEDTFTHGVDIAIEGKYCLRELIFVVRWGKVEYVVDRLGWIWFFFLVVDNELRFDLLVQLFVASEQGLVEKDFVFIS